jgi:nucleotide-binding universal stress UspA family protein
MCIVFGTTLGPTCTVGAEVAARLAAALQVPLVLVHASGDARALAYVGTAQEATLVDEVAALATEASRLRDLTVCDVQTHLAAGDAAQALASAARAVLATAILVVAGDGEPNVLGDTAERTARAGETPVLVLREPEQWLAWLRGERSWKILVGVDFGRASQAARQLAQKLRQVGRCEIVHCVVAESEGGTVATGSNELVHAKRADEDGVTVDLVRGDDVAAALAQAVQTTIADLVLVGQRRSTLLAQLWHGSISRDLIRRPLPVSVGVVPPARFSGRRQPQALRSIVVGVDFSEAAERAVDLALGVVGTDGTVHLVHVLPERDPQRVWTTGHGLDELRGELVGVRADLQVYCHVVSGSAADEMLALANQLRSDAIAVGSRSHNAVHQLLLGSVAAQLVERSTVPVLLVPLVPR